MNVSVAEVLAGAAVRAVPLSAECAGYLVLAAADEVARAPRRVEPGDVLLGDDGAIRVASGRAAEGDAAEGDLRAVLDSLLLRASAPTAGLLRASRRASGAGIEALVRELETALIPVNRAAARRSLARLERETVRALESGRIDVSDARASVPASRPLDARASVAPKSAPPVSEPPAPAVVAKAELAETPASPPEIASRLVRATREPSVAPPAVANGSVAPSPPTKPDVERTERLVLQERTAVLTKVAPKPENEVAPKPENEAELVETRPEPVVKRASMRPPAPPSTPVLPPVSLRSNVPDPISATSSTAFDADKRARELVAAEPQQTEPLPKPAASVEPNAAASVEPEAAASVEPEASPARPVLVPLILMVDVESRPNVTPFLGTRVSVEPVPPDAGEAQGSSGAGLESAGGVAEEAGATAEPYDGESERADGESERADAVAETRGALEEMLGAVIAPPAAVEETPMTESADPAAVASAVLQVMAPFVDDGDVEVIEVLFEPHEHTVIPHDEELIDVQGGDWTEPCPPLELEAAGELSAIAVEPSVLVAEPSIGFEPGVAVEPGVLVAEPTVFVVQSDIDEALDAAFDAVLIEEAVVEARTFALCSPSVEADVPCESDDILSVDISVLCHSPSTASVEADAPHVAADAPHVAVDAPHVTVDAQHVTVDAPHVTVDAPHVTADSELPPWATAVPEARDLTPPPRLALPVERPSDVEDLLLRLGEMPPALDDVRAGLRRLAGMEPTPPPPGIALDP